MKTGEFQWQFQQLTHSSCPSVKMHPHRQISWTDDACRCRHLVMKKYQHSFLQTFLPSLFGTEIGHGGLPMQSALPLEQVHLLTSATQPHVSFSQIHSQWHDLKFPLSRWRKSYDLSFLQIWRRFKGCALLVLQFFCQMVKGPLYHLAPTLLGLRGIVFPVYALDKCILIHKENICCTDLSRPQIH